MDINIFNDLYNSLKDEKEYEEINANNNRKIDAEVNKNVDVNMNLFSSNNMQYHNVIPTSYYAMPRNIPRIEEPKYINRQIKLLIHSNNKVSGTKGDYRVKLQEPLRNIITARLMNCILYKSSDDEKFNSGTDFITLHIDGFNKNVSTTTTNDRLHNSFAVLDYKGNTDSTSILAYNNRFTDNYDISYFDPPLNVLSEMMISFYYSNGNNTGDDYDNKIELLLETMEKIRIY
jgi:hypothetical protein